MSLKVGDHVVCSDTWYFNQQGLPTNGYYRVVYIEERAGYTSYTLGRLIEIIHSQSNFVTNVFEGRVTKVSGGHKVSKYSKWSKTHANT